MTPTKPHVRTACLATLLLIVTGSGCIKAKVEPLEVKHIYMTLDINIKDPTMVSAMQASTQPATMVSPAVAPAAAPATQPLR